MDIYRNNFSFHSTRYEEWMNGQCIGSGALETEIVAETSRTDIRFYISDIGNLEINSSSVFQFSDETTELDLDRIIYYHEVVSSEPDEPVECQLFRSGSTVSGIRFTMLNPIRVIEFYGNVVEIGQPNRHVYKESIKIKTAESIISNLKATYRFDIDELMKVAVKHFELYSDASTPDQIKGVVESLKLFVEVYKMLIEQTFDEDEAHMLLPKVCFFISICNLKICNIEQAYAMAKEGLVKADEVIRDSVFESLPSDLTGADDLKDLIDYIEDTYPQLKYVNNSGNVNPYIVDTSHININKTRSDANNNISTESSIISPEVVSPYTNIPGFLMRQTRDVFHHECNSATLVELPDVFIFQSNEHQRYENETPVMGLQKCYRTIKVEVNKNGCEGYKIQSGDGYIVKIFNNDVGNAQMSAKPMRLIRTTNCFIELRGYPLYAFSPFGWQPIDYSSYGLFIHFENGVITHCDLHMSDRNVRIEYRYKEQDRVGQGSTISEAT